MRNKNAKVSDPNSFITNAGSPIRDIYSSKVMKDGTIQLLKSGEENIQEFIDSFRESTDMSYILHNLSLGNTSVLTNKQMIFGDFTEAPSNLAEAQQILIDGENAFNQLPLDVRQKFDNNFRKWLFTTGSDEWTNIMKSINQKIDSVESVDSEVKEDVS